MTNQLVQSSWPHRPLTSTEDYYKQTGRKLSQRCVAEYRVAWRLIVHLQAHGWQPIGVDNGGGAAQRVGTRREAYEEATATDEARIYFEKATACDHAGRARHSVFLVFGNSPEELICDYTYTSGDPDGFCALVDAFIDSIQE